MSAVSLLPDAFGPVPPEGASRVELISSAIRWIAGKIGEPGVGDAFAGCSATPSATRPCARSCPPGAGPLPPRAPGRAG